MFLRQQDKLLVDSIQAAIKCSLIDPYYNQGNINDKLKGLIVDICSQVSGLGKGWFEYSDFDFHEDNMSERLDSIIVNVMKEYVAHQEFILLRDICEKVDVYFPFSHVDITSNGDKVIAIYIGKVKHFVEPNDVDSFLDKNAVELAF